MNGKESLENIVINFDNMGMICSNLGYEEFYAKDLHFKEIFKNEYESLLKDLDRLQKLEKENDKLKNAIDILKDKLDIKLEVYHNGGCTLNHKVIRNCIIPNERCLRYLENKQYELLKEVLGNE